MKDEDVKIGMEVHFCEPDFTSGYGEIVALSKVGGLLWAKLDWDYEVPVAYCEPTRNCKKNSQNTQTT